MRGPPPTTKISLEISSSSAIILLYLVILGTGAQSVTANRNTRYSNSLDEYKGVQQQDIIKY